MQIIFKLSFSNYVIRFILISYLWKAKSPKANQGVSNGRASAEMRNRGVFRNPSTNEVEFPDEVDINMNVDGGRRRMRAKRLQKQQNSIRVFDMSGDEKQIKTKETAFYTTDNSVVGLVFEEMEDGTTMTRLASRSVKDRRVCATNNEISSCWSTSDAPRQWNDVTDSMIKNATERRRRSVDDIPLVDDYNTDLIIEMILMVDQSMMDIFRLRNEDEESAVEDAALYMTMLMAEQGTDFGFVYKNEDGQVIESSTFLHFSLWVAKNYDTLLDRNFDHVAYITSEEFEGYILGQAFRLGGMCGNWSPIGAAAMTSINSDIMFDILQTLAHEVMHTLRVFHDGTDEYAEECPEDKYLMAPMIVDPKENPDTYLTFSKCTVKQAYAYIQKQRREARDCLTESTTSAMWKEQFCIGSGRGEVKDIDFQCQIQGDNDDFFACSENIRKSRGKKLVPARACHAYGTVQCGTKSGTCGEYNLFSVTDGTPCYQWGSDEEMICHNGRCREKEEVCGTETGLTTELIPVQTVCRCNKYSGLAKKTCCATSRKPDGSCCGGCVLEGDECVKQWSWSERKSD
ncbi:ADAM metallopeptidase domain 28 [Mactra antiquata]